jgi:hypothetical protein
MTPSGKLILNGQYNVAHLDASLQLLINHLHDTTRANDANIKPSIKYEDFISKLKTCREFDIYITIRTTPWTLQGPLGTSTSSQTYQIKIHDAHK